MKIKGKRNYLASAFAVLAVSVIAGLAAAVLPIKTVKADDNAELADTVNLQSTYMLGETIELPSSALTVDGAKYTAQRILYFPDGNATAKASVTLSQAGRYTLEYRAVLAGKAYSAEKNFTVYKYLCETTGIGSSAALGVSGAYPASPAGVVASIAVNEKLLVNKIIDLSGKTSADSIVKLFVTPQTLGTADVENLVFTFTDLYDESNVVTVQSGMDIGSATADWANMVTYSRAKAAGQILSGLEAGRTAGNLVTWEGETYQLHNSSYGSSCLFSVSGAPNFPTLNPATIGAQTLSISFDYARRRVYANGSIIIDLDEPLFFGTNTWNGFTDGKCLMSIRGSNYLAQSMNVVLTEIDGIATAGIPENTSPDVTPPLITLGIDAGLLPNATAGKAFPLPTATAFDAIDLACPVTVRAYTNYGSSTQARLEITDGGFIPPRAGNYAAVYTAYDRSGNEAKYVLKIKAVNKSESLSITLSSSPKACAVGELTGVSGYTVNNASGTFGAVITAVKGSERTVIAQTGDSAFKFRPMSAGAYTIEYAYFDYIETKTESYTLDVSAGGAPIILDEAALPKYLLKGCLYPLPRIDGIKFESGQPVTAAATILIQDDLGARRAVTSAKFASNADSTCTVTYKVGETEKAYVIPVIDVKYGERLNLTEYFAGDGFTAIANNDNLTFTAGTAGGGALEFINALQVFDFYFNFKVPAIANNFSAVNLYLTDSVNGSQALKLSYIKSAAGKSIFRLNDGADYALAADFFGASAAFEAAYADKTQTLTVSNFSIAVDKGLDGAAWNGFTSGKAYLKIELSGRTGASGVILNKLNNQPLSKVGYDLIAPEISMATARGERSPGTVVTIVPTFSVDVLDPDSSFSMNVTKPDGGYATALDGTVLDETADPNKEYQLLLADYGRYNVSYTAKDCAERETTYSYIFRVVNSTPPEILLSAHAVTAKVGDTVLIASVRAKGVTEGDCTVYAYLTLPGGKIISLKGNSFVPAAAGEYVVSYMVYDADNNVAFAEYTVTVT